MVKSQQKNSLFTRVEMVNYIPSNQTIGKILQRFDGNGNLTMKGILMNYGLDKNGEEYARFFLEYKAELSYLCTDGFILKLKNNEYSLQPKGQLFKNKRNKKLEKLELLVQDYPTILGGLIGGIIGTLVTITITILLG